ncbi:MipA/OmpV family protein [Rivibacter subsaxonicus]|uniref:Outer membrane scaffolding protein for murein synthesis (MipA/OmpV family) n=1 Tax=Rivibacter subsaxonicus TaxID=457575 RepID=A0A4Q7VWL4_9BURK|nr:MipA/OmpV family protein [Rivibacter subsaxonicus]RZU01013.1 outer membrane scaffolding protein for murein synthesis (MipA/OmpV family) [Rivibacter subsaxonicus]
MPTRRLLARLDRAPRAACTLVPLALACTLLSPARAQGPSASTATDVASDRPGEVALPVWEAGVVVGVGSVPDYPASDHSRTRALVLPVFVYRSPVLRVEDGRIRGRIVSSANFELDLSAAGAFNARNNEAREGMPALDYLFELGPQAVYRWDLRERERVSAHLKARAVFSTDFSSVRYRGIVVEPQLRWSLGRVAGSAFNLGVSASANFAGERLHDYFYEVAPQYARADRPAYDARGGYLGSELGLSLNRPLTDRLLLLMGGRLGFHAGAANEASPLFRQKTTSTIGISLLWTPWRSEATVSERPGS